MQRTDMYQIIGNKFNPALLLDGYKLGHRVQYPEGTQKIYSTFTPRGSRIDGVDTVPFFGLQKFIKEWLIGYWQTYFFDVDIEEIVSDYRRFMKAYLLVEDADDTHVRALHALGFLPIKILALPEGTIVPLRVPPFTIESTNDDFYWITNSLETLYSSELWWGMVSANTARIYREILDRHHDQTVGNRDMVGFSAHDFSFRGQTSVASAVQSGLAHLLFFEGTDTCPAIQAAEIYYNADIDKELVGASVNATEHAVMCAGGDDDEHGTIKRLMTEVYPTGILSIVSDTWDYWNTLEVIYPSLKDEIMNRDGRIVVRPDSGNPYHIICGYRVIDDKEAFSLGYRELSSLEGTVYVRETKGRYFLFNGLMKVKEITKAEAIGSIAHLWEVFGGTENDLGFKTLDTHIRLIYGEAIQPELMDKILTRLAELGFAADNVLFGVGSYGYLSAGVTGGIGTRDTFGIAIKATHAVINGEERMLFKDPKTDDGLKRSQRGCVIVTEREGRLVATDGLTLGQRDSSEDNLMKVVYEDGNLLIDDTFAEIRKRVRS